MQAGKHDDKGGASFVLWSDDIRGQKTENQREMTWEQFLDTFLRHIHNKRHLSKWLTDCEIVVSSFKSVLEGPSWQKKFILLGLVELILNNKLLVKQFKERKIGNA